MTVSESPKAKLKYDNIQNKMDKDVTKFYKRETQ